MKGGEVGLPKYVHSDVAKSKRTIASAASGVWMPRDLVQRCP